MNGTIKNIVVKRAFGFIINPTTRTEYFFHRDDFNGHWDDLVNDHEAEKDSHIPVEFEVVPSPKGPRASKVRRADYPNQAA